MTTSFKNILVEENEGMMTLVINRESHLNALSTEVLEEMKTFLESIRNKKIKGLVITGAGEKAFIAGADISSMSSMGEKEGMEFSSLGQSVSLLLEELHFPVVAAVNGYALGGGFEMALSCDFILSSNNAVFGLPEVGLGLIPGFGGTQRLAKVVGRSLAKELIFTGRKIKVDEAFNLGIILSKHETKADLLAASYELLSLISKNSIHAVGIAKASLNQGVDLVNKEGLEIENSAFAEVFNSYDMKEGTKAFLEKRTPQFKGE